ncbi:MAG: lysoplasmalogenase family protein [Trueperella sp.]|nr:lysoplasmalogenase family protein [Trueperella sp.]
MPSTSISDFLKKNLADALTAGATAVEKAKAKPERVALFAASAVNLAASAAGKSTIRKAAKLSLMPLIAAGVWNERDEIGTADAKKLAAALGFGWLGDAILMPRRANLNRGAIPFAVNHLFYQYFVRRAGAKPVKELLMTMTPLWAGSVVATKLLQPKYLPAAIFYGGLLAHTSTIYADEVLTADAIDGYDPRRGLEPGGLLFLISDSLLITRAIVGEEKTVAQLFDAAVMFTYIAAQLLISDGISELSRRQRAVNHS